LATLSASLPAADTPWSRGRFDAREGPGEILFGRMYEDVRVERRAFRPGSRVFCIASAGCTAIELAQLHEVVAVDINPVQLAYAERRIAGEPCVRGVAERVMALARRFAPAVGWTKARLSAFVDLDDTTAQTAYWHRDLDTRRFRIAFEGLLSFAALSAVYASPFLEFLPPRLGAVMRRRMECCFARHPNRTNPYARALLVGELPVTPARGDAKQISLVHADAADFLERAPSGSFDAFTLSNILDGADADYERRLMAAVAHAAARDATVVLRSFREPASRGASDRTDEDRSLLWGVVDVRPAHCPGFGEGERR
jgi:S-adenosylmethionine:diacylglycerol 3-amino-3-carboxypropyl transferase